MIGIRGHALGSTCRLDFGNHSSLLSCSNLTPKTRVTVIAEARSAPFLVLNIVTSILADASARSVTNRAQPDAILRSHLFTRPDAARTRSLRVAAQVRFLAVYTRFLNVGLASS